MSDWNASTIAEFRANEGRVGGNFEGAPLVLLHHRGHKSGREYVNPLMYLPHDTDPDIIYIFATRGGAPTNPDWYRNLAATDGTTDEVGTATNATASTPSKPRATQALPSTHAKLLESVPFLCSNLGGCSPHPTVET